MSRSEREALHVADLSVGVHRAMRRRRSACLTIERDGSLVLSASEDLTQAELNSFIREKRQWIYRKLAEKETLSRKRAVKELVDGEGYLYLGRSHRLMLVKQLPRPVTLDHGRLLITEEAAANGHGPLIDWYIHRGYRWLEPRIGEWSRRLKVEVESVDMRDLGYRWGTATSNGHLRIHWAAMQLLPSLIDYVLVHELAHVREASHGPAFWRLVSRALPDAENRKRQLAHVGGALWLGS